MKKHILNILIILTLYSCQTEKSYDVKQLDAYSFRRDYMGSDTLTGKALEEYIVRNPVQNSDYKSKEGSFYNYLTLKGIVVDKELILNKIDSLPDDFEYTIANRKVQLHIAYPESFDTEGRILMFREEGTIFHIDTLLFSDPTSVTYSTMDLNTNGTDELYMLFKSYAVNGHNYELSVYELTEK